MRNGQGGRWTEADVPAQRGRTAVITGANTGLGFETARVLAARGAQVVLACQDLGLAKEAAARIPGDVRAVRLDLASLASVREAAGEIGSAYGPVDLLVNNAGVMMKREASTEDGFELQFGTNHLGHFALTGLLLERMLGREGSRVVTVSSNGHKSGRIDFADLQSQRRYRRMAAYYQSKLANLMFTYELQRRLAAARARAQALAAHPGKARTELTRYLPGWMRLVASSERARDLDAQQRLWRESERLTGVSYPV